MAITLYPLDPRHLLKVFKDKFLDGILINQNNSQLLETPTTSTAAADVTSRSKAHISKADWDNISSLPGPNHVCDVCQRNFPSESDLTEHRTSHECPVCHKIFKRKMGLKQHMSLHSREKKYACNKCNKKFRLLSSLCNHREVHNKTNPFLCDTCGKSFKTKKTIYDHLRIHLDDRPFVCKVCNKGFKLSNHLSQHKRFKCGKGIRGRSAKANPNVCEFCLVVFETEALYDEHMQKNHGPLPYVCKVCTAAFEQLIGLEDHLVTHTASENCMCPKCGVQLSNALQLSFHDRNAHLLEKTCVCPTCGKSFKNPRYLSDHKNIHLGYKPYACDDCSATFASYSNLCGHRRKVHASKPICKNCGKHCRSYRSLNKHHCAEPPPQPETYSAKDVISVEIANSLLYL